VAQLTGLVFRPTLGLSSQSSDFTYTVSNPAGLSATGVETLAISASGAVTGGISPDGSILMAGAAGSLVTSSGTWTFNTPASTGGYAILLNGQQVGASRDTLELEIANQGNLYAFNGGNAWYEWVNSGWTAVSGPG